MKGVHAVISIGKFSSYIYFVVASRLYLLGMEFNNVIVQDEKTYNDSDNDSTQLVESPLSGEVSGRARFNYSPPFKISYT